MATTDVQTGYAPVGDLNMYYEVHGRGRPLVLLHGAYMTIEMLGPILPGLAGSRQVIAVELQGHGRTADVDRPLTYEGMADDVGGAPVPLQLDRDHLPGRGQAGEDRAQHLDRHVGAV